MIQRLTPTRDIVPGFDRLWRCAAQVAIIGIERFGEAALEPTPVFDVKAVTEARDHFLNFYSLLSAHKISYLTSAGNVARPAGDILPSAIIRRARSLFVFVQFDFGRRGEKRMA